MPSLISLFLADEPALEEQADNFGVAAVPANGTAGEAQGERAQSDMARPSRPNNSALRICGEV